MHGIYLHGFASSAKTAKGVALGQRLARTLASYRIPALEGEPADEAAFFHLTMTGIRDRAAAAVAALPDDGRGCLLIGSSLGGYTAALLAAQRTSPRIRALLLIAPAFGFTTRWSARLGPQGTALWQRQGHLPFFHHAHEREMPLGYGFLESCQNLPDLPDHPGVPVAIVHGIQDETVDHRQSIAYQQGHAGVELHLVDGDHRLMEPHHEDLIAWCAEDLVRRTR